MTFERLEDQIAWYDRKSALNQRRFKWTKAAQMIAAAAVSVVAAFDGPSFVPAILGAAVVVLEGFEQLNQYQQNWITYRSTCEALKHEKYLFLAGAGPYAARSDARRVLAERIEGLISQEHAKWTAAREERAEAEEDAAATKRPSHPGDRRPGEDRLDAPRDHGHVARLAAALIAIAAAAVLAAGCGGDESSALCEEVRTAQGAVDDIRSIEPGEGAAEDLRQSVATLRQSLSDMQAEAGEDLGPQIAAVRSSFSTLRQDAQSVASQGQVTAESVKDLAAPLGDAVTALQALGNAAPDCDL